MVYLENVLVEVNFVAEDSHGFDGLGCSFLERLEKCEFELQAGQSRFGIDSKAL